MTEISILISNIREYLNYAKEAYEKNDFNTAITLFFKALVTICDYEILRKTGSTPYSHESRFRKLESDFPHLYRIIDRDFPYYTDSYRITISKRIVDLVKGDVEKLIKELGLEEKIK